MARDYKAEYRKSIENGWRKNQKSFSTMLSGAEIEMFYALLDKHNCKNLSELVRGIMYGDLTLTGSL